MVIDIAKYIEYGFLLGIIPGATALLYGLIWRVVYIMS